jgi:hypothetical protein
MKKNIVEANVQCKSMFNREGHGSQILAAFYGYKFQDDFRVKELQIYDHVKVAKLMEPHLSIQCQIERITRGKQYENFVYFQQLEGEVVLYQLSKHVKSDHDVERYFMLRLNGWLNKDITTKDISDLFQFCLNSCRMKQPVHESGNKLLKTIILENEGDETMSLTDMSNSECSNDSLWNEPLDESFIDTTLD